MQYSLALFALTVAVFSYFIRAQLIRRRRQSLVRQFGCQPIPKWSSRDPLGRDYAAISAEAWKLGRYRRVHMEQFQKAGSTYYVDAVGDPSVRTIEPLNFQVIATSMDDWTRDVRSSGKQLMGDGDTISTQEGATWQRTRDLVTPLFRRAEIRDIDFFEKFVDRLIEKLPRDGQTVDLQYWSRKLYIDTTSEFCFGESLDSLRDETGKADEFIMAFERAVTGHGKRIMKTGWRHTVAALTAGSDKQWAADCKTVHDYVDGCIARFRAREKDMPKEKKRYMLLEGMSEAIPDPVQLRFHLLGIFSTGREVAAMAFSNTMFLLARHPDVWARLRTEATALQPDNITFDRLNQLTYFKATINEALRLHNPVPISRRVARVDAVLPRGGGPDGSAPCLVEKGTPVWVDTFPMSMDPKTWGDDVEDFRPKRFEGRVTSWEYRPFSGGPRVCPAQQQTVTQILYLLVRLTREYERLENRDPCLEYLDGVTQCLHSRNGVKVALHPGSPN